MRGEFRNGLLYNLQHLCLPSVPVCVFEHVSFLFTCCIQSWVPLLVSCSQMLWAESVRATAHTLFFTCISLWFICHTKKANSICVSHPCSMLISLLRRTPFVSDNIWTLKRPYAQRDMISSSRKKLFDCIRCEKKKYYNMTYSLCQ